MQLSFLAIVFGYVGTAPSVAVAAPNPVAVAAPAAAAPVAAAPVAVAPSGGSQVISGGGAGWGGPGWGMPPCTMGGSYARRMCRRAMGLRK